MDQEQGAVALGIIGTTGTLIATLIPYVFAPGSAMTTYYASGFGGPPLIALFGIIATIVVLAGYQRRTDPALSTGIVTVLGLFMLVLSLLWATSADPATIGGFTNNTLYRYHPWTLPLTSFLVTIAGGWYARVVL